MTEKTKYCLKMSAVGFAVGGVAGANSIFGYDALVKLYDKLDFRYQKKMKRYKELQVKFSEGTLTISESDELSALQSELSDISKKNARKSDIEEKARVTVGIANTIVGIYTGAWALKEEHKYHQSQKNKEKPDSKIKTNLISKGKGTKK